MTSYAWDRRKLSYSHMRAYSSLWNIINQKVFLLKQKQQTNAPPPQKRRETQLYVGLCIITFKYKNYVLELEILDWNVRYLDIVFVPTTDLFCGISQFSYSSHAFF